MGFSPWITCLWPGLPRLWWRGEWSGFVAAVVFAVGLNAALAATFIAPHWVGATWRLAGWTVLAVFWVICVHRGATRLSQIYAGDGRYNDALFGRAQEEYLKGQWFEAESLLLRLVREEPADVEGRLLLATLYRHTRRPELAAAQLDQMSKYPHAARWAWEIRQERHWLQQTANETAAAREASVSETSVSETSVSEHREEENSSDASPAAERPGEGLEDIEVPGSPAEQSAASPMEPAENQQPASQGGLSKAA